MTTLKLANHLRTSLLAMACLAALAACKEPTSDTGSAAVTTPAAEQPAAAAEPAAPVAAPLSELSADDRQAVLKPSALCNLERAGNDMLGSSAAYVPSDASNLVFKGWIGDEATNAAPTDPKLMVRQIGGARVWQMPIELSVKRADVAKYKNAPGLENAGFATQADLSTLPPGTYRLLLVHERDGSRFSCDNGRNIQIGG